MLGARILRATGIAAIMARLPGRLGFACAMLEATRDQMARTPYRPKGAGHRGTVALLTGCVMEGLYTETNRATARTLVVNDYAVIDAPGQQCCGALHAHAGDLDGARALARINVAAFEASGAKQIAVNAAGCGAFLKEYGHLLADDPAWASRAADISTRVRDVSELLAAAGPHPGGALPMRVTYDAPCHLLHAQRIADPPLAVLRAIPELQLVPLAGTEQCCGGAGIYNLTEPDTSAAVLAPKLAAIQAAGAAAVVTGNPGCLMQLGAGLRRSGIATHPIHLVDLLDAAYSAHASRVKKLVC